MISHKDKLLKKLQICDFALTEAALYLDTHPNNAMALEYFNKHNKEREEVLKEYVEKYGPIRVKDNKSTTHWEWIKSPWPWENEEDCE